MKTKEISFVKDATTAEAARYAALYAGVVVRNIARGINRAAHGFPWAFVLATALLAFAASYVGIAQARAERDQYDKRYVDAARELESYRAVYGPMTGDSLAATTNGEDEP